jgi:hypothetical protein
LESGGSGRSERLESQLGSGDCSNLSNMATSAASSFLSRGSSGNNANMRGLVQFIADLRNARARELEEKRINKELANIRFVVMNAPGMGIRLTFVV